jgi:serine/threonine protein kinase
LNELPFSLPWDSWYQVIPHGLSKNPDWFNYIILLRIPKEYHFRIDRAGSRHLLKNTNIEKEVVIKWFKQIVLGLKELHRHKCHHRDLKTGFGCNFNFMTKKLITLF